MFDIKKGVVASQKTTVHWEFDYKLKLDRVIFHPN